MATRRSTDSLVEELARKRGVTPANAVWIAVTEALERDRHRESRVVEEIDQRRLDLAASCGQDYGIDQIWEAVKAPIVLESGALLVMAIWGRHQLQATVIVFLLLNWLTLYLYGRGMLEAREARRNVRESLALEIVELAKSLSQEYDFLSHVSGGNPIIGSLLSSDELEKLRSKGQATTNSV